MGRLPGRREVPINQICVHNREDHSCKNEGHEYLAVIHQPVAKKHLAKTGNNRRHDHEVQAKINDRIEETAGELVFVDSLSFLLQSLVKVPAQQNRSGDRQHIHAQANKRERELCQSVFCRNEPEEIDERTREALHQEDIQNEDKDIQQQAAILFSENVWDHGSGRI